MARKRQSKKQIAAGKKYQKLKNKDSVIGSDKYMRQFNIDRYFKINELTRKQRKITYKRMVRNWFSHLK